MRSPQALKSNICADRTGTHHKAPEAMDRGAQRAHASKPSQKSLATRFISNGTYRSTLPGTFGAMSYSEALKSGSYVAPSYPAPPPCRLLMQCPEIRNDIYELAFTAETSSDEEVDLLAARPPSGNLLRTSCKVHAEAKGPFVTARDNYWSSSNFVITRKDKSAKAALAAIPDAALQKITTLKLELPLTGVFRPRSVLGRPPKDPSMGTIEWVSQDYWQVRGEGRTQLNIYISIRNSPSGNFQMMGFTRPPPNLEAIRAAATGEHSPTDMPVSLRKQLDGIFMLLHDKKGSRV